MKNKRIINAYDSINPSITDKQRMLDAILAEANLEDNPRKTRKKKKPVIYTGKATKESGRSIVTAIAASLVMLLIAGVVFAHMIGGREEEPYYAEPTEEVRNVTVNMSYIPVLDKYRAALREGWSKEQCEIEGISTRFYMPESVDFTIGKRMLDINDDGKIELLIGHDDIIWDLYTTLEDGTPIQLLSDVQDGWQYSLNEDGLISAEYFSKDDCYAEYYSLDGHKLVMELQLEYSDGQWMQQVGDQEWEAIAADSAEATMNSFVKYTPDWTPIQDHAQMDADAVERYTLILEKYETALAESWTLEQCQQNDISPDIFADTTIRNDLGWCLADIDSNGIEELVISDGITLFDLYVMMPHNGGPGHIICANGGETYQLCENGVIQNRGLYSGTSAWRNYTLVDTDIIQQDIVFYDGELNQYYYGSNGEDLEPIPKDKAGNLIVENRTMELELTRFVKPEPFYPDADLYYRPLLEMYQKALDEDWDPPTCMENGLSLMVAHSGEYYDKLGYTIKDLDQNGVSELIITDGLNIYDLYTIIQDEEVGPLHLVSAMERIQYYLTDDGWIYNMGSGGAAVSYHTLYALEGRELKLLEGYMMDANTDPNDPWFYYDGENQLGKCPTAEAAAAMDSIVFAEIPFTPFK